MSNEVIDTKIEQLMNAMAEDDSSSAEAASVIAQEILRRSEELNDDVREMVTSFCNQIISVDFNHLMGESNHANMIESQKAVVAEAEAEEENYKKNLIDEIVNFRG